MRELVAVPILDRLPLIKRHSKSTLSQKAGNDCEKSQTQNYVYKVLAMIPYSDYNYITQ
jgi:hypothetical protein